MSAKNRMKTAFRKEANGISVLANELKREDGTFDSEKIKQLKELTAAAKELASLLRITETEGEGERSLTVKFSEEGEKWAN